MSARSSLFDRLFANGTPLHDPVRSPPGDTAVKTTTCYMCACRCGINVHLRDGEVRFIEGNPRHPLNRGVICAKGSAGIMKQVSPARLTQPLRRRPGAERGDGEFEPISWDDALQLLEQRLRHIRATDPKQFALFTGRDQMQALTALFAREFGTPNYAAHGGFCSVNMAAGMIYTIGGSFWEFGGPDLERARLFIMLGTAEDHHSNPMKLALSKFKRAAGRFISINPIRTGYSAIADEWIPIRPGTDGALLLALIHELLRTGRFDAAFIAQCTNGAQLVRVQPGQAQDGLFATASTAPHDAPDALDRLWWDERTGRAVAAWSEGAQPALFGHYTLDDGTPVATALQLLREQVRDCTADWAQDVTGIPAVRIRDLAQEMAHAALDLSEDLPLPWTDWRGQHHATLATRPLAFHAMRGLAAHSNGFHTVRALAILMSLLGTIDAPGGFRHKAPYPKDVPPDGRGPRSPDDVRPDSPLPGAPLFWPASPDDLALNDDAGPLRIDKAFSWEYPLAVHGLMHNVVTNAWRGDPYRIDTLLIFMSNMAWNSAMNTLDVRRMLRDKDDRGDYRIPLIVVCDAFHSEMTAFADLLLPDTSYLERFDAMSLLDRPISEFDAAVDAVRVPVVAPLGQTRPFQDVLVELGSRLKLPAFVHADGSRKFRDYADFIVNYQTAPGSGIGFLSGWRGADGSKSLKGEPNPRQWEMYAQHDCVHVHHLPETARYRRNWNRAYLDFAREHGWRTRSTPIIVQLYSEVLQQFRLAALGRRPGRQPPEALRARVAHHFDPLPFWEPPLEQAVTDLARYPLAAVTQRPMAMYHAWDSQNAWLRQIHGHNRLVVHAATAQRYGIADGAWLWVSSPWGRVRARCQYSEAVEPGTVWTWNAIGKASGFWGLHPRAAESQSGFLLNHLITDELPAAGGAGRVSNSDPLTGQAGWYDVRVRIEPADAPQADDAASPPAQTWPQFAPVPAPPHHPSRIAAVAVLRYFAGRMRPAGDRP
ncbi:molybdopterin oxidoreductase family protein [Thiomonas sp.]|uniref:molybdopterin oxidoreductase family protein n=1 Tax=Thiomonas sp. TaxID=2047785 RepID=UPI0026283FD5|nr:molybdopterin oxidoreductase family protein [Thiomonas sp.]